MKQSQENVEFQHKNLIFFLQSMSANREQHIPLTDQPSVLSYTLNYIHYINTSISLLQNPVFCTPCCSLLFAEQG